MSRRQLPRAVPAVRPILRRLARRAWLGLGPLLCVLLTACRHVPPAPPAQSLQRFEYTQPQMGLPFRIVLYARDRTEALAAATAAYARIAELNQIMSDYEDDSELTKLSQSSGSGRWVPVSPDLWKVLDRSQQMAYATRGAFDVTVGPVVQLWRRARRQREMPPAERLAAALSAVGYQHLRLDPQTHSALLQVPHMRLDLGAIAKGYATDEAIRVLRERGIRSALVAGSGDMTFSDPPPGQPGWRIEVAPLDVTNAPPARHILLSNCGLATSGDVFQHVEIAGRRYSHIVDPRTGIGLTDHSLVTVVARDGMTADSLSTTISVLGPAAGLDLVRRMRGAEAHVVSVPDGRIILQETRGFRRYDQKGPARTNAPARAK